MNAGIIGVGKYNPEKVLTNADFEKMMDTSDEWIRTRTGIEERRIAADDMETSDMAYEAAVKAVKHAGISAEELDLILVATVTPDQPFPTVSNILQDRLGAKKLPRWISVRPVPVLCTGLRRPSNLLRRKRINMF